MLLDPSPVSPVSHCAKANTQEKKADRVEIRFIQGLSLRRWTRALVLKAPSWGTQVNERDFIGRERKWVGQRKGRPTC